MKHIKNIVLLLLITMLLSVTSSADAGLFFGISYDNDGYIRVTGSCDTEDETYITLTMIRRTATDTDGEYVKNTKELYTMSAQELLEDVYVKQTKLVDKSFSFEFIPTFKTGIYDVYVNKTGDVNAAEDIYVYINKTEQTTALGKINSAAEANVGDGSDTDIYKYINSNLDGLFYKIKKNFTDISETDRIAICKMLCNHTDFTTLDEVNDYIIKLTVISKISANNGTYALISDNAGVLGINLSNAYNVFGNKDEDFKKLVYDDFKGVAFDIDFADEFANSVYLNILYKTENVALTPAVMEQLRNNTSINVDGYFTSSNKSLIEGQITGVKLTKSELEGIITQANLNTNPPLGGGGGMGGGGGGGSTVTKPGKVEVMSSPIEAEQNSEQITLIFSDVKREHWAYEAINAMYAQGAVSGDDNGYFNPDNMITREEFAKIVAEMFKLTSDSAVCNFEDVETDRWSYKYIASLYSTGVISGKSALSFAPTEPITREDAAHILYNIVSYKNNIIEKKRNAAEFIDADEISDYATVSVMSLYAGEILSGYEDNSVRPKSNITRAESAQLIINLFRNVR